MIFEENIHVLLILIVYFNVNINNDIQYYKLSPVLKENDGNGSVMHVLPISDLDFGCLLLIYRI